MLRRPQPVRAGAAPAGAHWHLPESTIAAVAGATSIEDRVWGTASSVALAVASGADIVRVHDVAAMRQVARLADAVVRGWPREEA